MGKPRTCGTCDACCHVLRIDELGKPEYKPCQHLVQIRKKGMCGAYETRPDVCRTFRCGWLDGIIPAEWRPDRVGVMIAGGAHTIGGQLIHAHEVRPGAFALGTEGAELLNQLTDTHIVVRHHRDGTSDYDGPENLVAALNDTLESSST